MISRLILAHRPELFDEYTRRQYLDKAPNRNPFGEEETPNKFAHFDVFTKLKVLFQLSQWTLTTTRRLIDKMPETKEHEQQQWVRHNIKTLELKLC